VKESAEASIRVKGSRFLGFACPVISEEQFKQVLLEHSRQYHDATHNCWAYRILSQDRIDMGSSDAGEPSGTAGRPILSAIEGRDLLNVGVIVTRYFGGTKLGTGGLARAYADCASLTLDGCTVISKIITDQLTILLSYDLQNVVMRLIDRFQGKIEESKYSQDARLTIAIPRSRIERFKTEIMDACSGSVRFLE
jgi:uncharacterized YigZ family protein